MSRRYRLIWSFGLLALALTGCDSSTSTSVASTAPPSATPTGSPPPWTEPAAYVYTVESHCGERLLIGKFQLTITARKVTQAVGLDEPSKEAAKETPIASFPTLGELLDEYREAVRNGAAVARVVYDSTDGHPLRIEFDPIRAAIDDEACYLITDYRPAA